jgi:hypothetical protein
MKYNIYPASLSAKEGAWGWRCGKRSLTRTVGKKEGIIEISRNIIAISETIFKIVFLSEELKQRVDLELFTTIYYAHANYVTTITLI